uniref:EAL domain-containing protein n=1 Tax=Pararhizobium sp. IMCC3301 TaxID=3067904 RepID=UPI0027415AE7|nr:EAL domain-containing protein [Pararhizobium sp. IMCC3301]
MKTICSLWRTGLAGPDWLKLGFIPILLLLLAFVSQQVNIWHEAENWTEESRMALSKRPASGDIVFVAIDKQTLDEIGVWPWPRSVMAEAIDRLVESNALEIFIDVDFSTPSSPEQDAILAKSIRQANGTVSLAAFSQTSSVKSGTEDIADSVPLPIFLDSAWLATVNVFPDHDGIVRRFPFGNMIAGEPESSMPALLSGKSGLSGLDFAINFAIDPDTVPLYSFIDLLSNKLPESGLEQKTVVIGAHAVELRDTFAVPVYGSLPGAMLQIVAAETLKQNFEIVRILAIWPLLFCALLQFLVLLLWKSTHLLTRIGAVLAISILAEGIGFILFYTSSISLPTAALHAMNLALLLVLAVREFGLRNWLIVLADARTRNANNLLRQVFDDSSEAILIVDEAGAVLEASPKARIIFGQSAVQRENPENCIVMPEPILECVRQSLADLNQGVRASDTGGELILTSATDDKIIEFTVTPSRLTNTETRTQFLADGRSIACVTARDITTKRRQAERLDFLSKRDELTGAFRRHAFLDILNQKLARLTPAQSCQIMAINLNRFKTVNTTLGRDVGDQLLCAVVTRLAESEIGVECISRLGGDTFAVLLQETDPQLQLHVTSLQVANLLAQTYFLESGSIQIDVRISYARSESPTQAADALLNCAEMTLDEGTDVAGQSVRPYDPVSSAKHARARQIERELRPALENRDFQILYQPQVDVNGRHLVGMEALTRWSHPVLGAVSPDEFIAIAEASGMIEPLGDWILQAACCEAANWTEAIPVAVNVSPVQFLRGDIIASVTSALETSGLKPNHLQLEITESTILTCSDAVLQTMHDLRSLGVTLALDDFGTGYASLGYMTQFPFDQVKVDKSFIRNLTTDPTSQSIVQFTKTLSDVVGATMLCEGVETEEQLTFLKLIGCDQAQGFLFGTPLSAKIIRRMIAEIANSEHIEEYSRTA